MDADRFNKIQKKLVREREARIKAEALNRHTSPKTLDDWLREADACGLDYGTYRALIAQGKTFEQLKRRRKL